MLKYNSCIYDFMFGNINEEVINAATCIGQCTGCMCNCRCSCSGGIIADFEWEMM